MKFVKLLKMMKKLPAYWQDERGMSLTETAILFPVLLSLLMGVYDLGQGIIVNQKTITASQVIGDLVTRYEVVDQNLITDIVNAGELSLAPYPTQAFGYDIASVEFDEEGDPFVLWRETFNMEADDAAVDSSTGLGVEGEGVVIVSVVYAYEPFFSNFVVNSYDMNEVAFLRGRKSPTVTCLDCEYIE
jgi:Flp pilus assembly protein TadG